MPKKIRKRKKAPAQGKKLSEKQVPKPNRYYAIAGIAAMIMLLIIGIAILSSKSGFEATQENCLNTAQNSSSVSAATNLNFSFEASPIRESFYEGGRVVVFTQITSKKAQNYFLSGEWHSSSLVLDNTTLMEPGSYNDTFYLQPKQLVGQYRWNSLRSSNNSGVAFVAKVADDSGETISKTVAIRLINDDTVLPYLGENQNIKINDNATIFALNSIRSSKATDYAQAQTLLNVTRHYLSIPEEKGLVEYYETNDLDSLEAFGKKQGTSSEYSSVYVMLLRSIGIPAKAMKCSRNESAYFYAEALIEDRGWIASDVYGASKSFGEGPSGCESRTEVY